MFAATAIPIALTITTDFVTEPVLCELFMVFLLHLTPGADQAAFCRRRHQPSRPTLARIRPGKPAPAMGPGIGVTAYDADAVWSDQGWQIAQDRQMGRAEELFSRTTD